MIKPIAIAVVCVLTIPAEAQTLGDTVVSQFSIFKKSKAALDSCMREEGRMQIERNEHYDTLLRANARLPDAPTIGEIAEALGQVRAEDEALSQKRGECMPLFDELALSIRELRRGCAAYTAPTNEPRPTTETLAIGICGGPAKAGDGQKPATQ